MVVLHVIPDLFPHGGTPRKLAGATGRLHKRGICQAVLVLGEADEGMVDQSTTAGGRVLRAPRRAASDPRLIWDVAAASVRVRADVVVTNFARADIYGALGARLVGRAVIKELEGIFWSDRSELIACGRMLGRLRCLVIANSKATLQAARRRGGVGSLELVLFDDGSTDATHQIVETFDDPRIRVLRGPGGGISSAEAANSNSRQLAQPRSHWSE